MVLRIAAAVAIALAPSAVHAKFPRQPTGQWVVNFDAAQCFAARNFGTVENPLYLVFKAPPLGEVMQVSVMRKGSALRPEQQKGTIQFDEQAPISVRFFDFEPADSRLRTFLANLPLNNFSPARNATSVRITTPGVDERFALTSMAALLKTMDQCVQDLRRVWNISEAKPNPLLKESAKGNMRALFSADDYPTQAMVEGGTGTLAVAILVDQKGKVADCAIVATSGVPVLDAQTCAVLLSRASFRPAIGLDGKPAKSAYLQRITWRMM